MRIITLLSIAYLIGLHERVSAFSPLRQRSFTSRCTALHLHLHESDTHLAETQRNNHNDVPTRRQFIHLSLLGYNLISSNAVKAVLLEENNTGVEMSSAFPSRLPLYYILRVREATEQESRLISSGKFKDVQRANVKLAVRFMLQNYKLSDNLIAAAGTLDASKRQAANEVGQRAVENLFTILEYFDSRDVENLKVGTYDSMAGKEPLVLKGLEAARTNIDEFVSYFDTRDVDTVRHQIDEENELNSKEFDPNLGVILNPSPRR